MHGFSTGVVEFSFLNADILMIHVVLCRLTTSFRESWHMRRFMIAFSRMILCLAGPCGRMSSESEVVLVSIRI